MAERERKIFTRENIGTGLEIAGIGAVGLALLNASLLLAAEGVVVFYSGKWVKNSKK